MPTFLWILYNHLPVLSSSHCFCHLSFNLYLTVVFISVSLKETSMSVWFHFVASFVHLSATSFPLIPICAGIHTSIIVSPIIWILYNVCCISIKTSGLPTDFLFFKLINKELESEHITVLRGLTFTVNFHWVLDSFFHFLHVIYIHLINYI